MAQAEQKPADKPDKDKPDVKWDRKFRSAPMMIVTCGCEYFISRTPILDATGKKTGEKPEIIYNRQSLLHQESLYGKNRRAATPCAKGYHCSGCGKTFEPHEVITPKAAMASKTN